MQQEIISTKLFEIDSTLDRLFYQLNKKYPWRTLYRGLFPKSLRKTIEYKLDIKKQKKISDAWQIILNEYQNNNLTDFTFKPKKTLPENRIIWQYWGQASAFSDLPEVVQICFNSVEKYQGDYQIIRLNDNNIHEYLDIPDFIIEKRKNPAFKYAFFADFLRLALLDSYGGVWIDATVLLTNYIPSELLSQPFFMFQRNQNSPNKHNYKPYHIYFNWHHEHQVNCLNSFIIAKKGSPIIHICLNALIHFWRTQNYIPHYYFFQIMFNTLMKRDGIQNCPILDDTLPHLLQDRIKDRADLETYRYIIDKTSIHKLTYIKKYSEDSYFAYLKKEFLSQ